MVKERATKQPSFIRPYQVQTPRRVRASALTARSEAAAPDAQKNTYECAHRLCPFWFSSIPFLPRYISVLHANELSVVKPEYYRGVCLISSLPFLFAGDDPVFKRNGGLLRFTQFQISASCWRTLPTSIPTPHPETITI